MKKKSFLLLFSLLFVFLFSASLHAQWVKTDWNEPLGRVNFLTCQDKLFARVWDSRLGNRCFVTPDDGISWALTTSVGEELEILSVVSLSNTLLAGTWDCLYMAGFDGLTWDSVYSMGIPGGAPVWSLAKFGNRILAGGTGMLFVSSDNGVSWDETGILLADSARIMTIIGNSEIILAGSDFDGIFISTDDGLTWEQVNTGLTDLHISQLLITGSKIFAITLKGLFVSADSGNTWKADNSDLENINCMVQAGNLLFAGTDAKGVYSSSDNGLTWISANAGLPSETSVWSLSVNNSSLFAGSGSGIWRMPLEFDSVPGDVNGDNQINIIDALLIAQYYVHIEPSVFIETNADVDCNNVIDIVDALLIAQYYVKLIPALGCQ